MLVCLLAGPAGANIEPAYQDAEEVFGDEPWQSFYGLLRPYAVYYTEPTFHDGVLYVVEKEKIVRVDPETGEEEPWPEFILPREASYLSGICFHEGDFWFSGALRSGRTVDEWEEFLFQRIGDGWVYRGEYSGPLASDGENLYAARHNVIGVWRDREFEEILALDERYKITGLAWDTGRLWASAHDYYGEGEELAYLFRIDVEAREVDGWLPLPWVVYSVWTFRQWYEFTHVVIAQGLASDGEKLYLVAEDSVWTADPAAACTEGLPEAFGYCVEAGTEVYDAPDGSAIGELRARDPVYRLDEEDGWWRVYTPLGVVGWVPADTVAEGFKVSLEPPG
ncbi:MAG TPA: hypothetical protein VM054_03670 [bacterium]|nr:hypothetical protein [bacterium]